MPASKKECEPDKASTEGAYFRLYRIKRGYTQLWASEQLQVSPMFLSNIELGKSPIPRKYLVQLQTLYRIPRRSIIRFYQKLVRQELETLLKP